MTNLGTLSVLIVVIGVTYANIAEDVEHQQKQLEEPLYYKAVDCEGWYEQGATSDGVYTIFPSGTPISAYCEMSTGGWTRIQKRTDGTLGYARDMASYALGFGDQADQHWIGLNAMHELSKQGYYVLRVELEDYDGYSAYAEYDGFRVDEGPEYTLWIDRESYRGTAGDSLSRHRGMKFSTYDRDQDTWDDGNCSTQRGDNDYGSTGWWFYDCSTTMTNGMPYGAWISIYWGTWGGNTHTLKGAVLKIKRKSY